MTRHSIPILALWAAVLIAAATPASGQADQPKQPSEPLKQVYCPMAPDVEIDPEVFTDYQGRRVYFCCDRCRARFLRDPELYGARPLGGVPTAEPRADAPEREPAHGQGHNSGKEPKPGAEPPKGADHQHGDSGARQPDAGHDRGDKSRGHAEHEHGSGPHWVNWLGGFHPPMTHFPIGVLLAGALAELLFIVRRRETFDHTARYCVAVAALTGVITGVLGWLFAGFHVGQDDALLAVHRWLGTGIVLGFVALVWASERAHRRAGASRGLYYTLLFGGAVLVLAQGFIGGAMVYGLDQYLPR